MNVITIKNLSKTYSSGEKALSNVSLEIKQGEIFALLGPNGAGKSTLIGTICGTVSFNEGQILAGGHDVIKEYKKSRSAIGLVPQELMTEAFESVWDTVTFSRRLFGKPANPDYLERILRQLTLWEKRNASMMSLSGGMKRRVMIAKALSHEPSILFLDEPTAGVDVELRKDMWELVRGLRESGVTIILTTHYIEEAEEMADRVGVIQKGQIILVEDKTTLMKKMGKRQLLVHLTNPLDTVPEVMQDKHVELTGQGHQLRYEFDTQSSGSNITDFLRTLDSLNLEYQDLHIEQSSLEQIFVDLVGTKSGAQA